MAPSDYEFSYLPQRLRDKVSYAKPIGEGSFGQVFLIKNKEKKNKNNIDDPSSSCPSLYVLKRVGIRQLDDKQKAAAVDEALILSRLDHCNICSIYDFFLEGQDYLYLQLEYASKDLRKILVERRKSGTFSEVEVLSILSQCCKGLGYIHKLNIIHRDIKTENIFLHESVVKLGDFGIAKVLDGTHAYAQTICGTPYYFSPELTENRPYGKMTDVWAMGCVCYELMQLDLPFKARNLPLLLKAISTQDPNPLPASYSKPLRYLVKRMLSKNPSKRPSVTEILSHKSMVLLPCSNEPKEFCNSPKVDMCIDEVIHKTDGDNLASLPSKTPLLRKNERGAARRSSSLYHRLNRQHSHNQQGKRRKTWDECMKEAEANVIERECTLLVHKNGHVNNRRYDKKRSTKSVIHEEVKKKDDQFTKVENMERRQEGINTLVQRLDLLKMNLIHQTRAKAEDQRQITKML